MNQRVRKSGKSPVPRSNHHAHSCCSLTRHSPSYRHADEHSNGIKLNYPDELEWKDGPPSLLKGAEIAVLEGDPAKEGPFVFRVKVPDGYQIPPHTHPKVESVTVITGTSNIGMGEKCDQSKTEAMTAGTYGYWEPDMKHFVWTKGETIAQFHGIGHWRIEYVNPKDDPRKSAAAK